MNEHESTLDLRAEPLPLNDRFRVTADGLQWIVQKQIKDVGRGGWKSIAFCQTKDALIAYLGWEAFGVGEIAPTALRTLQSALPRHRRLVPGYDGPDIEAEIAKARALDRREALAWMRKTGGRQ